MRHVNGNEGHVHISGSGVVGALYKCKKFLVGFCAVAAPCAALVILFLSLFMQAKTTQSHQLQYIEVSLRSHMKRQSSQLEAYVRTYQRPNFQILQYRFCGQCTTPEIIRSPWLCTGQATFRG